MLAPDVFVALDIRVEDLTIAKGGSSHRRRVVEPGASDGHDGSLEEERVVVKEGYRDLLGTVVGQSSHA